MGNNRISPFILVTRYTGNGISEQPVNRSYLYEKGEYQAF